MASRSDAGDASGAGSKKRKAGPDQAGGRGERVQQKRAALYAARAVPAQPADTALKDGELDLQAFVAAHEFEIKALEESMATSKAVSSTRAFQQVPRGLRRRTASHNPKRVPKRLRARARREMGDDNTPTVEARKRRPRTTRAKIRAETARRLGILAARKRKQKLKQKEPPSSTDIPNKIDAVVGRKPRPKIRRNQLNEPPPPSAKFRKRQMNKTWLPTHGWHAKRARMTEPQHPLWRFAVPLTPNEKIYRATHRTQGDRGVAVWDMSYLSTIGLYGNPAGMERILKRVGISQESCWNMKGQKWRLGTRSWSGFLSKETNQGRRHIGPATVLWNPALPEAVANDDPKKNKRQVFFRLHPSAFLELFNELLRLAKMETPQLYIEDLRFEIGSIELTGPASTEALMSILTAFPAKPKSKTKHAELFQLLTSLSNPASLPANAVLGFSVQDPRLRYPPKRPEKSAGLDTDFERLQLIADWAAEDELQPYSIFDRDARHTASCLPSQKHVNRRRTAAPNGVALKPSSVDPPIPILLLATRNGSGTQLQGTWTLLAPWKCILPMWYSLVHCPLSSGSNPRFAGMDEIRQVAFERGLSWFPADCIATNAGVDWELEQRRLRGRQWSRRPKSKRVAWDSLDLGAGRKGEVGDGLSCDFEFLFGLSKQGQMNASASTESQDSGDAMDIDGDKPEPKQREKEPLLQLNQVTKNTFNQLVSSPDLPPSIPPWAIITVRIVVLARGVVGPCARIYRLPSTPTPVSQSSNIEVPATHPPPPGSNTGLPSDLREQWLARSPPSSNASGVNATTASLPKLTAGTDFETRKVLLARELTTQAPALYPPPKPNQTNIDGHHPLVPGAEDLIGFVTTGSFSLSEGCGAAVGSVAVDKVLPGFRLSPKQAQLCIVRNSGENVGWLARWEVI